MMRAGAALAAVAAFGATVAAQAQEFSLEGFGDFKLLRPGNQQSWTDGGLGKISFGGAGHRSPDAKFYQGIAEAKAQLTEDFTTIATLRVAPDLDRAVDLLDAYARYRPVSTTPLRLSFKLGAFFPPVSLENDGIGWASSWTPTPSAINTWVGEELRTIGGEAKAEWRFDDGAIEAVAAIYGWNQFAGTMLADRGWSFGDQPTGLFGKLRLPDAGAIRQHRPIPQFGDPFTAIENTPGWYGGLSWRETGLGQISLLQYDNRANPAAFEQGEFAWRTDFTSLGLQTRFDDFVFIGQAMNGETEIKPTPTVDSITHFQSAFLLVGWELGDWHPAARIDFFSTHVHPNPALSEHGRALTLAVNWSPLQWLRLSGEALRVDSTRAQRATVGLDPQVGETQLQLRAQLYF